MRTREVPLETLLEQLPALFPASDPLRVVPGVDELAPYAERFSGGHAARWFAACDGQEGHRPFADSHRLCSLAEALGTMHMADVLRAEPDGYWVEPHWLAITTDLAGQHYMLDDRDGRVLAVAHDDDHVHEVASSPEAWLLQLIEGHARGTIVWDEVYGLTDAAELERLRERQRIAEIRLVEPMPAKHKLGLVLTLGVALLLIGAFIWYLETHR